jgi:hypothetical protein
MRKMSTTNYDPVTHGLLKRDSLLPLQLLDLPPMNHPTTTTAAAAAAAATRSLSPLEPLLESLQQRYSSSSSRRRELSLLSSPQCRRPLGRSEEPWSHGESLRPAEPAHQPSSVTCLWYSPRHGSSRRITQLILVRSPSFVTL